MATSAMPVGLAMNAHGAPTEAVTNARFPGTVRDRARRGGDTCCNLLLHCAGVLPSLAVVLLCLQAQASDTLQAIRNVVVPLIAMSCCGLRRRSASPGEKRPPSKAAKLALQEAVDSVKRRMCQSSPQRKTRDTKCNQHSGHSTLICCLAWILVIILQSHSVVASSVAVVQLPSSRMLGLPPLPSAAAHDPSLPQAASTADTLWLSHLRREEPITPLPVQNALHAFGVGLVSGNASLQLGGWLRLDLHLRPVNASEGGGFNWTLPQGTAICGRVMPAVTLWGSGLHVAGCATGAATTAAAGLNPSGLGCGAMLHCAGACNSSLDVPPPVWAPGGLHSSDMLVTLHAELPVAAPLPGVRLVLNTSQASNEIADVRTGAQYTCITTVTKELWCWGGNAYGQLGVGSTHQHIAPQPVNPGQWGSGVSQQAVIQASTGYEHTCVILDDDSLWCWGAGQWGRLGLGDEANRLAPQRVQAGAWGSEAGQVRVTIVSCGQHLTCAALADDTLWCWGLDVKGALGIGATGNRLLPTQVVGTPGTSQVHALSAGGTVTCVVLSDATVWCWGRCGSGQVGAGTCNYQEAIYTPQHVNPGVWGTGALLQPAVEVSAGGYHTCAIQADSALWCWGKNYEGQIGIGSSSNNQWRPVRVNAAVWGSGHAQTAVVAVSAARRHHTCALLEDGTLWCWGKGLYGRLGTGSEANQVWPVQIMPHGDGTTDTTVVGLRAGPHHSCAILAGGTLQCWGRNQSGQLGTAPTPPQQQLLPQPVPPIATGACWQHMPSSQPGPLHIMTGAPHAAAGVCPGGGGASMPAWVQPGDSPPASPWAWLRSVPALLELTTGTWPAGPALHTAVGTLLATGAPPLPALVALRQCGVDGDGNASLQLMPRVLLARGGVGFAHLPSSASASAACSEWQLGALVEGTYTTGVGAAGDTSLAAESAAVVPLSPSLRLRLLSVQAGAAGGGLPAAGGGVHLRLSHALHALADVRVSIHTSRHGFGDVPCPVLCVQGFEVGCTAPPGAGTVYISVSVDGQLAEEALPLSYGGGAGVVCV